MKTCRHLVLPVNGLSRWLAGLLLAASVVRAGAVAINFDALDAAQGFSFQQSIHTNVGFLTALTLNGTALSADLMVKNPANFPSTMPVVAVLDSEDWQGPPSGTLQFHARISTANKTTVTTLLHNVFSTIQIQLDFQIFDYSTNYFETFSPLNEAAISAQLATVSSTIQLTVSSTPNSDVISPQNYELVFSCVPLANQECLVFTTPSTRVVRNFGIGPVIPVPPAVSGVGATQITSAGAMLQATVNPGNGDTAVFFKYGTSPTLATSMASSTNTVASGTSGVAVAIPISNLTASTTYYYQAVAGNAAGANTNGIFSFVTTSPLPPVITAVARSGASLTISGTNGSFGATYYVISSTNLSLSNWVSVATNQFESGGNFNLTLTNAVDSALPQRYYRIKVSAD